MNGQKRFLSTIIKKLDEAKIPYMICGSLGSSVHGEPRATNDIDIIIACGLRQIRQFIASFQEEKYYADLDMAEDAFRNQSMFNIIDLQSGWKADLIFLKDNEFAHEEFSRRKEDILLGLKAKIISPEDSILSKLEWAKMGESERQLRDALGVAVVQWENLDISYLNKWATKLDIKDLLDKLMVEAEKLK